MAGRLARDEAVERRRYTWRWWRVVVALAVGGLGVFLLQGVDVEIGRWCERVGQIDDDSAVDQIVEGFKNFAQLLTIMAAIALIAILEPRRKRIIIAILVAQIGAKVTYEVFKHTVARERPYVTLARTEAGATGAVESGELDTWRGWRPGNTSRDYQSFPSGHTSAAFAFAGVLAWHYRRAAAVFWILALGCAVTRVLELAHWPSDCAGGMAIGYAWAQVGLLTGRWRA